MRGFKGVWRELGLKYVPLDGETRGGLRYEACVRLVLDDDFRYGCPDFLGTFNDGL